MTIEEVIAYAIEHTPQANAVIAALASKGFVIVPKEPTREMWAAGGTAVVGMTKVHHDKVTEAAYRAMLDAAPSPIRG